VAVDYLIHGECRSGNPPRVPDYISEESRPTPDNDLVAQITIWRFAQWLTENDAVTRSTCPRAFSCDKTGL
jgi:hypothetical protein